MNIIYISKVLGAIMASITALAGIIHSVKKIIKFIQSIDNKLEDITILQNTIKEIYKKYDALADLALSSQRQMLLDRIQKILDTGLIETNEFIILIKAYKAYVNANGNSIILNLWEKVQIIFINDLNQIIDHGFIHSNDYANLLQIFNAYEDFPINEENRMNVEVIHELWKKIQILPNHEEDVGK